MLGLVFGIGLVVIGVVLFFVGRSRKEQKPSVNAKNGSVAVGGNNSGDITNIQLYEKEAAHGGHAFITVAAIVIEIIGIAVTVWHAWHMARS